MEATSFSQWAANLLGYTSHTVPIGFPPAEPPISMLGCLRRDPARVQKKASRDIETINVPVRDDGERTNAPADPFSTLNLKEGGGKAEAKIHPKSSQIEAKPKKS